MAEVRVNVPPGMDPEKFNALVATFIKQRTSGAIRGKAIAQATRTIIGKNKAEYDKLVEDNMKKLSA